ncbi:hypothetical protein [Pseudovibrio sp. POLY-S9]|uniref:hypothetical protein n=1 Tax=Pseudovibrio sp. POLY-S9 TaxID=1576596 RepID=UPI00070B8414|nr:hypothetical protein [Pseudovibrio sp. POLY-S9]
MDWLYWLLWIALVLYLIIGLIAGCWTARVEKPLGAPFQIVVFAWLKAIGRFLLFLFGWPYIFWAISNSSPQ